MAVNENNYVICLPSAQMDFGNVKAKIKAIHATIYTNYS